MKFVGHLDMLKLFQRAIRRAKLPIFYSGGFNPHQETIFAMPLTLGMDTTYDVIDIKLTEEVEIEQIKSSINKELPNGFEIINVRELNDDEKNCAKDLVYADYIIRTTMDTLEIARAIDIINKSEQCLIEKKSKKTTREVDIKPDILKMALCEKGLQVTIATGSKQHLKPELLHEYMCGVVGTEHSNLNMKVTRTKMYRYKDEVLCEL